MTRRIVTGEPTGAPKAKVVDLFTGMDKVNAALGDDPASPRPRWWLATLVLTLFVGIGLGVWFSYGAIAHYQLAAQRCAETPNATRRNH